MGIINPPSKVFQLISFPTDTFLTNPHYFLPNVKVSSFKSSKVPTFETYRSLSNHFAIATHLLLLILLLLHSSSFNFVNLQFKSYAKVASVRKHNQPVADSIPFIPLPCHPRNMRFPGIRHSRSTICVRYGNARISHLFPSVLSNCSFCGNIRIPIYFFLLLRFST